MKSHARADHGSENAPDLQPKEARSPLHSEATHELSSPRTFTKRSEPIELREVGDYVVRRGDTLNSIARRSLAYFGQDPNDRKAVKAEESRIIALNERWKPDLAHNANKLEPGMLLIIQQNKNHALFRNDKDNTATTVAAPEQSPRAVSPLEVRSNGSYVVKPEDDILSIAERSLVLRGKPSQDRQDIMNEAARILYLNFHHYPQVWTDARTLRSGMILETFEPEVDDRAKAKLWTEVPIGVARVARQGEHVVVNSGSRAILRPGSNAIVGPGAQAFVFPGARAEAFPGSVVIAAGGDVVAHPGSNVHIVRPDDENQKQ